MIGDFVEESANAPGTATIFPLAGASPGARGFLSRFGANAEIIVGMHDGAQGQTIIGRLLSAPDRMQIVSVLENTAGTTARLNFTGPVRVYSVLAASRMLYANASNVWQGQGRRLAGLASAAEAADAMRRDQAGWVQVRTDVMTNASGWPVALPAEFSRFRVEWEDVSPATASEGMFFRLSTDGGASYHQGGTDYPWRGTLSTSTGVMPLGSALSYGPISGSMDAPAFGELEFYRYGSHQWCARAHTRRPPNAEHVGWESSGWLQGNSLTATHLIVGIVDRNIAAGRFRLKGCY